GGVSERKGKTKERGTWGHLKGVLESTRGSTTWEFRRERGALGVLVPSCAPHRGGDRQRGTWGITSPAWAGRSMTPTVLLLLSVFTVRGSGCKDLDKGTVRNLQNNISNENSTGFPEVFPKDYVVPRHYSPSTQCHDQSATCCVFKEATFLSHSWMQLVQQLERIHLKRPFITELIQQLNDISKDAWSFQETPDPSVFPSVNSSPGALLTLTSSLLSRWLELNCPTGENVCIFHPSPTEEEEEEKKEEGSLEGGTAKEEERNIPGEWTVEDLPYMKEGERGKRWITGVPTNGYHGSSTSPGLLLCTLSFLRIIMDVIVREL
ncbi:hypothetical protein MHYP_G00033010, partial [Metynnis hypsauchen]